MVSHRQGKGLRPYIIFLVLRLSELRGHSWVPTSYAVHRKDFSTQDSEQKVPSVKEGGDVHSKENINSVTHLWGQGSWGTGREETGILAPSVK